MAGFYSYSARKYVYGMCPRPKNISLRKSSLKAEKSDTRSTISSLNTHTYTQF